MDPQDQTFSAIEASLKRAIAALREVGIPFLLGGSLASWARGGPETTHDLDLIVTPDDADRTAEVLAGAGMRIEDPPEEWLVKAWDGDVLIDVIFHPAGLEITPEVIERGELLDVAGIQTRVMAIEDVLATKLLAMSEHGLDYSSSLQIARALREQIDWEALRARTGDSPFAQAFFTLVEALGVVEPAPARGAGAQVRVVTPPRAEAAG